MDTHNLPAALFLSERGTKVGLRRNEPFVKLRCHTKKNSKNKLLKIPGVNCVCMKLFVVVVFAYFFPFWICPG